MPAFLNYRKVSTQASYVSSSLFPLAPLAVKNIPRCPAKRLGIAAILRYHTLPDRSLVFSPFDHLDLTF